MKIFLNPQVNDDDKIVYNFEGDKVTATIGDVADTFDFSGIPDGELEMHDKETGNLLLETTLPVMPILSAKKESGVLYLVLLNWISSKATESERFPEWIESENYKPPVIEKVIEGDDNDKDEAINKSPVNDKPEGKLKDWGDF